MKKQSDNNSSPLVAPSLKKEVVATKENQDINRKARNGTLEPTFHPETSHKKAMSIYGGVSKTSTNVQSSKKAPKVTKTVTNTKTRESSKKEQVKAIRKPIFDVRLLDQLPQEVVLEILDYYLGSGFKACLKKELKDPNRANLNTNTLEFNESMFFKQYFGKFMNRGDSSPKLIFKRAAFPEDDLRSAKEFHHLLTVLARNNQPINSYFRILCTFHIVDRKKVPLNVSEKEANMLQYISNVFEKDRELCEKITEINLCGLETFESVVTFAANNFPNIERVRLGFSTRITKGYITKRLLV